ncbi:hypothetical protein D3C72_1853810 [compost metagenome]
MLRFVRAAVSSGFTKARATWPRPAIQRLRWVCMAPALAVFSSWMTARSVQVIVTPSMAKRACHSQSSTTVWPTSLIKRSNRAAW